MMRQLLALVLTGRADAINIGHVPDQSSLNGYFTNHLDSAEEAHAFQLHKNYKQYRRKDLDEVQVYQDLELLEQRRWMEGRRTTYRNRTVLNVAADKQRLSRGCSMWLAVCNCAHLSEGWAQKLAHSRCCRVQIRISEQARKAPLNNTSREDKRGTSTLQEIWDDFYDTPFLLIEKALRASKP